jgi:dTDP-glucose pyrophosphorylase
MLDLNKHSISHRESLRTALERILELGSNLTLFVTNDQAQLVGTLTDGDSRRGLLNGLQMSDSVEKYMQNDFFYVKSDYKLTDILNAKENSIRILPIVDKEMHIIKLISFEFYYSLLPLDAFILAGGEGIRLRPLTENLPKPMLKIGSKPILEHCIDLLSRYGIDNIQISVNYLGDKIINYFKNGSEKGINISYVKEETKLGTIGSISLAAPFIKESVLIMNADLLTTINLEDFYLDFENKNADISIASIPYSVNVPYAVLDIDNDQVLGLKEKPTITYYSNAGIYIIKKKHLKRIARNSFLNITDLITDMIDDKLKVTYYPILDYWLDIGKNEDFAKASNDIKHIRI